MHLVRLVLLVGAGLQQEAHHLQVALVARQRQRRLLELVRVGVDAGAVVQEDLEITTMIIVFVATCWLNGDDAK